MYNSIDVNYIWVFGFHQGTQFMYVAIKLNPLSQ